LKTQKFNLERKIQDILTADTGEHKSGEIREKMETKQLEGKIESLNKLLLEKQTKLDEHQHTLDKVKEENQNLKITIAQTSTK